jgi:uncharacterized protein
MNLDRRLIDILCCPVTRQPLALANPQLLGRINQRIAAGEVRTIGGEPVAAALDKALVTPDLRQVYPVIDGIPALLPDSSLDWQADESPVT